MKTSEHLDQHVQPRPARVVFLEASELDLSKYMAKSDIFSIMLTDELAQFVAAGRLPAPVASSKTNNLVRLSSFLDSALSDVCC